MEYSRVRIIGSKENNPLRMEYRPRSNTENYFFHFGQKESRYLFGLQGIFKTRLGGRLRIRPIEGCATIMHADYECIKMSEYTNDPNHISFIDLPRRQDEVVCEKLYNQIRMPKNSILYEADIIYGGNEKLKETLSNVLETENNVVVHSCCTPLIIGDDIKSIVQNQILPDKKVVYSDVDKDRIGDSFLKEYEVHFSLNSKNSSKSINLIGFPKGEWMDDLISPLNILGISVNQKIFPDVNLDMLEKLGEASLNIFFPNKEYDQIYGKLRAKSKIRSICPMPPYGYKNTFYWYKYIAKNLEIDTKSNKGFNEYIRNQIKDFRKDKEACRKFTLGMVLSKDEVLSIVDPTRAFDSIPIVSLLADLGFKLSILIYSGKGEYDTLKRYLSIAIDFPDSAIIDYYSDRKKYEVWIKDPKIDAIYSDFFSDERLIKTGKNQISLNLDYGLGFMSTKKLGLQIRDICGFCFRSKYLDYMIGPLRLIEPHNVLKEEI